MRPNVMLPLVHATAHNPSVHHHHQQHSASPRRSSSGGSGGGGEEGTSPPAPRGFEHRHHHIVPPEPQQPLQPHPQPPPPAPAPAQQQPHPPLAPVNPSQSPLFCLVWNRAWEELVKRCKRAKPRELFVHDAATGNTLLHEACRVDPPPAVIDALSALARVPNFQGATPLHMAASHRCSAGALAALLEAAATTAATTSEADPAPTALTRQIPHHPTADLSSMGRAPIHYACMSFRGLDMDAFMLLLDETLRHGHRQFATSSSSRYGDNGDIETRDDLDDDESYLFDLDDDDDDINQSNHMKGEADETYYDPIFEDADLLLQRSSSHHRRHGRGGARGLDAMAVTVNVMSLKDAVGMTPLALLFRRYRQRVRAVISRIDQLHVHNPNLPSKAALVSAMTVHVELGELWEKARRIIAKLTQARLVTEQQQQQQQLRQHEGLAGVAGSSRGGADPVHEHQFQTAARWAAEKHKRPSGMVESPDDVLPIPDPVAEAAAAAAAAETDGDDSVDRDEAPPPSNEGAGGHASSDEEVEDGPARATGTSPSRAAPTTATSTDSAKAPRRQFRIVHASVGLVGYGCPPEMIRLAISLHPHQVHEMDEDGNLPLHIAVQSSSYLTSSPGHGSMGFGGDGANHDWNADPNSAADDRSVRSAWSFFSTATISQTPHPFDKVIKILLQHYPEGAKTPQGRTGKLPLTLAIRHGNRTWQDGIRTLLNAYPPALHSQRLFDPVLYPRVLATLGCAAHPGVPSSLPLSTIGVVGGATTPGAAVVVVGGGASGKRYEANDHDRAVAATPTSPLVLPPSTGNGSPPPPSSKQLRREACARYTFYHVLRTKPEWLTPDGRD